MVNPLTTIHNFTRYTTAKPIGTLGLTHAGKVDVATMIDNGVTNLSGKTLSKWIHYFLDRLTKMLSFSMNMFCFPKI